jgi:DNA-binding NarL/FixJ family response regulator
LRVLTLLAQGHDHHTAARVLHVTHDTVKTASARARRRLGALTTAHAVALAIATRQLPAGVAVPATAPGVSR